MPRPCNLIPRLGTFALVAAIASNSCSDNPSPPGGAAGLAGAAMPSAGAPTSFGGSGGSPPMAGTNAGGAKAGASAGGTSAGAPAAGASNGGSSSAGTAGTAPTSGVGGALGGTAGAGGAAAGAGGTTAGSGGASGGKGGASGAGGTSGAGGGAGAGDRCDIAKFDASDPPEALALSGNLGTHDPVVIFAHGRYYLFHTADGVGAKTSTDLREWKAASPVFASNPSWIATQVPGATNLWAPDISYFGGKYHLYYSASTFGSNRSCIGHASRAALDTGSWTDHGSVICSNPGGGTKDDWNAIDPNVVLDEEGTPWLSFGSFWGGLKMIRLDQTGARSGTELHSIAARPEDSGALEAPFIVRRCGYYYLFASFDKCCDGANSTYKTMVGRSASVLGPYTDKQGTTMMSGGGTLVLQGGTRWRGPGHNAVIFTDTAAFNVYHSYDANNNGSPILRISELAWDAEGWPRSGGP